MSTLSRYLLWLCSGRCLGMLAVFMLVFVGGFAGTFIGRGVPLTAIAPALPGFLLLAAPLAVPLGITAGILLTIGQLGRDGEFRALAAAGLAPATVVKRLWPLIVVAIISTAALMHLVLPPAMLEHHRSRDRFLHAALAHRVNSGEHILRQAGTRAYARSAVGQDLTDIFATRVDADGGISALYAPHAHWFLGRNERGQGLGIELENAQVIQRMASGQTRLMTMNHLGYPLAEAKNAQRLDQPDTWSTPRLSEYISTWTSETPGGRDAFNSARLSWHLRLFVPLSLLGYALFAAGLGLRRSGQDPLLGVIIVVLVVCATTVPAMFHAKTGADYQKISPGWMLWPPHAALAGLGLWWLRRPDLLCGIGDGSTGWWQRLGEWLRHLVAPLVIALRRRERQRTFVPKAGVGRVLDRLMLRQGLVTWLGVLFLGTLLVSVAQLVGQIGFVVQASRQNPLDLLGFLVLSIPEHAALWLPLSVAVAALLVATPLLRRGNLVALCAAGIPLRRAFATLIVIAGVACLSAFVLNDQIVPRTQVLADAHAEQMVSRNKKDDFTSGAWTSPDAFWILRRTGVGHPGYDGIAIFAKDGQRAILAEAMVPESPTPQQIWRLDRVTVADRNGTVQHLESATPESLGLASPPYPRRLAASMKPDRTRTSDQLLRAQSPLVGEIFSTRFLISLAPLFCLLVALPGFVRFDNRLHIGSALTKAALISALPLAGIALANRAILSSQGTTLATMLLVIAVLSTIGGWRWLRMAP